MSTAAPQELTITSLTDRIRNLQSTKAAAADPAVHGAPADPRDKGTSSIPDDPEESNANSHLPPDAPNTESNEDKKLEDGQLHPVSTGKNVPGTSDGDAKDEKAKSPTTPLSKISSAEIAEKAQKLANTMKGLMATSEPSEEAAPPAKAKAAGTESFDENDIQFNDDFHIRLASTLLADEEGRELAAGFLQKAAGAEAAREIMEGAAVAHNTMLKAAAEEQQAAEIQEELIKAATVAELEGYAAAEEMLKEASAEDREDIVKFANVHSTALSTIEHPLLKQAYMGGAGDAAAMEDAMAEGGEAAIPGGEGEASIEELAAILEELVASGEIGEEEALQALEMLAAEGGVGGEEAAMSPEEEAALMAAEGGGEELPPELKEAAARAQRILG